MHNDTLRAIHSDDAIRRRCAAKNSLKTGSPSSSLLGTTCPPPCVARILADDVIASNNPSDIPTGITRSFLPITCNVGTVTASYANVAVSAARDFIPDTKIPNPNRSLILGVASAIAASVAP